MRACAFMIIFICSFSAGIYKALCLRKRRESLEAFLNFLNDAAFEIRERHSDVFEIAGNTSFILFDNCIDGFCDFSSLYKKAKEKNLWKLELGKNDLVLMDGFFADFGKGSSEEQLTSCENTERKVERLLKEADTREKKYGKIYSLLGAVTGIGIIIFLL